MFLCSPTHISWVELPYSQSVLTSTFWSLVNTLAIWLLVTFNQSYHLCVCLQIQISSVQNKLIGYQPSLMWEVLLVSCIVLCPILTVHLLTHIVYIKPKLNSQFADDMYTCRRHYDWSSFWLPECQSHVMCGDALPCSTLSEFLELLSVFY